MTRQGQRRARRPRTHGNSYGLPIALAGLTLLGLAAAVILSNLPGGGGTTSPREIGQAGHDGQERTQGPDIHFSTTGVDFGDVPLGKEVSYSFSFANVGSETLRILDAKVRVLEGC